MVFVKKIFERKNGNSVTMLLFARNTPGLKIKDMVREKEK